MNIIAVDCGGSYIKGALIRDGEIIKSSRRQASGICRETELLRPVRIEQLVALVDEMISDLAAGLLEASLCICNEMHGFLLADADGKPYTDYISWQHEFGGLQKEILQERVCEEELLYTGMPLRTGLPSCGLLYLSRRGWTDRQKGRLFFYTLGDYILKRLSGQEPMCHPTNAAATGLYDLRTGNWNPALIRAVSAEHISFPDIGSKEMMFEKDGISITAKPAVGDQQAALYGAGLYREDMLSINIGTGGQVSRIVHQPDVSDQYQIRPYFGENTWIKTIPHLPAGRALNVYIRFIKDILDRFGTAPEEEKIWEILMKAEEDAAPCKMQCDLSFFENAVTDHRMGAITDIEEYGLDAGSLMHTVFRQTAANFVWAAERMMSGGPAVRNVMFSGGAAEKIEKIRTYIMECLPKDLKAYMACGETLMGLYKYGMEEP